jgi:hypothetical protein
MEGDAKKPPPGWYQNQSGPGERWWDGEGWTDHVRPGAERSSGTEALDQIAGVLGSQPRSFWLALLSLVAIVVGSFMPWARALFISVSGTEGDGIWFIIGAALVLASLWAYAKTKGRGALLFPGIYGAFVAGDSLRIIARLEEESEAQLFGESIRVAEVGPGLYVTLIGGAALLLFTLVLAFRYSRPTQHPQEAPAGWYPDPANEARERYWDGSKWRDEVR